MQSKIFNFGEKDATFQFMSSTSNKHPGLDIWYSKNLDLMPPLPDAYLVGIDKKNNKTK